MHADLGKRYRLTLVHGRHSTPVEVSLRLLVKHLNGWSYKETAERVAKPFAQEQATADPGVRQHIFIQIHRLYLAQ